MTQWGKVFQLERREMRTQIVWELQEDQWDRNEKSRLGYNNLVRGEALRSTQVRRVCSQSFLIEDL